LAWHNYVATVVHVDVKEDGKITVPHAVTVMDCGFYVNPERIRSQVEGAAVMGMSHALYSGITFENGAVEQSNFFDYKIASMENFPKVVDVHIVEPQPGRHAAGVGEPGLPPFAPALANAVFAATGKRLRNLPMGEKVT
jgi:isoquinoline 1-oxidoreductase beta subunit